MIKKIAVLVLLAFVLSSCKSKKTSVRKSSSKEKKHTSRPLPPSNSLADAVIHYAKKFEGVKYKYGGTTKKGMDCSGLVTTAFNSKDIVLPRTTSAMAVHGDWIDLKKVRKGDLLFFATRKNSRKVNHVGIVTYTNGNRIEFIHASTSAGVIVSSLAERYWYFAFVQARRVL